MDVGLAQIGAKYLVGIRDPAQPRLEVIVGTFRNPVLAQPADLVGGVTRSSVSSGQDVVDLTDFSNRGKHGLFQAV